MNSGKKTSVIIWSSAAAAVAGVIAVAAFLRWKGRSISGTTVSDHLRDVQDVLTDCYQKIREIENRIPEAIASSATAMSPRAGRGVAPNGTPAFDS